MTRELNDPNEVAQVSNAWPERYAVHANGTFWGIFPGVDADAAIEAAVALHGTEGDTSGLTAATVAETLQRIDRDYRDNEMSVVEAIARLLDVDVDRIVWDGSDGVFVSDGEEGGAWMDDDFIAWVIAWVEA